MWIDGLNDMMPKGVYNVFLSQARAQQVNIQSVIGLFKALFTNCYSSPLHDRNSHPIDPYEFVHPVVTPSSSGTERMMEALLSNPKVRMRDPSMVEHKLKFLIDGGIDKLLVISDFDYTLSRFHDASGVKCWTTHGVFDAASEVVSSELGRKVALLKAKYLPIEFDPHMSIAEKTPHMENWWKTAHEHIIEAKFTRQAIEKFVQGSKIELRDEAEAMVVDLSRQGVPFIIFSAGIGNVIDIFMRKKFGKMPANVHIISNMMDFNEEGVVTGFREPLIHTFCKNGSVIKRKRSFFNDANTRTNVLLMGDSLGDLNMDVGVTGEVMALKIGFLNFNVDTLLDNFLVGYDIVLIDDQTVQVARNIIDLVIESNAIRSQHSACSIDRAVASSTSCRIEVVEEQQQRREETDKPHTVATDVKV